MFGIHWPVTRDEGWGLVGTGGLLQCWPAHSPDTEQKGQEQEGTVVTATLNMQQPPTHLIKDASKKAPPWPPSLLIGSDPQGGVGGPFWEFFIINIKLSIRKTSSRCL